MATKFDAVEARKRQKEAAKKKERKDGVGRIYPVVGITNSGYIKLGHNGLMFYADVFKPKSFDLFELSVQDADQIESELWGLHQQYPGSIKELYMNFPETNQRQQTYFRRKIEQTRNPIYLELLQHDLSVLKQLEKTYRKLSSWIWFFGDSVPELERNLELARHASTLYTFERAGLAEKEKMLQMMNNPEVSVSETEEA